MSTRTRISKDTEDAIVMMAASDVANRIRSMLAAGRSRADAGDEAKENIGPAINRWGTKYASERWEDLNYTAAERIEARTRGAVRDLLRRRQTTRTP